MEQATYTRRENARRAGIDAGVPVERIKITVHKGNGEVRFGWKEVEPASGDTGRVRRQTPAPATPTASAAETAPTPPRSERSAPKRPRAGGKCAAVWDYLDANPVTTAAELREVAAANGWNQTNATCELYAWRKFIAATREQN